MARATATPGWEDDDFEEDFADFMTNFWGAYFSRRSRALVFCGSLVRKRAPGVSCSCPVNTGAPVASSTRYLDAMGTSRLHGRHRGYLG